MPPGLPSDLLRRRPDVRAAERQLAAATADIGVATADLYPKFNLMGMAELISTNLATLFAANSIQTTGNAAISLPIFDGGRRRGVIAERRAAADQALIAYKKAVLVAVQDVEDALADYNAELKRNAELRRGVDQAERATRLAQATYDAGLSDFQPVLDAQGSVLEQPQRAGPVGCDAAHRFGQALQGPGRRLDDVGVPKSNARVTARVTLTTMFLIRRRRSRR